jgi:hypothetical protein
MVVVVGIDVHKGTHCAVAVDEAGRQLGAPVTVRATDAGHRQLLRRMRREHAEHEVRFAVEDCRHVSGRLERALLDAAVSVVRVPPKLMAGARASARTRGKSDPIDALAIARAALREPDLPVAEHTHASRQVAVVLLVLAAALTAPGHPTRYPPRSGAAGRSRADDANRMKRVFRQLRSRARWSRTSACPSSSSVTCSTVVRPSSRAASSAS